MTTGNSAQPQDIDAKLEAMLAPAIQAAFAELTTHFDKKFQEFKKAPAAEAEKDNKDDPMAQRLALLEKQLKEQQDLNAAAAKETQRNKFLSTIDSLIDDSILDRNLLKETLTNRFLQDAVEKKGTFIVKDGRTLEEAYKAFLTTEGKIFVKATVPSGTGTPAPTHPAGSQPSSPTLDEMLKDMV